MSDAGTNPLTRFSHGPGSRCKLPPGQLRPVPAPPGRARLLTREGFDVIQVPWSPSAHPA